MTESIQMGRGEGKSTLAIRKAQETGAVVISPFPRYVKKAAEGTDVEVVGADELHKLLGRIAPVVVDDADVVLQNLLHKTNKVALLEFLLRQSGIIDTKFFIFNHD